MEEILTGNSSDDAASGAVLTMIVGPEEGEVTSEVDGRDGAEVNKSKGWQNLEQECFTDLYHSTLHFMIKCLLSINISDYKDRQFKLTYISNF